MANDQTKIAGIVERQLASMANDYRAYFKWDEAKIADALETARPKLIEKASESGPIRLRYRMDRAPINEHSTLNYAQQGVSRF